MARSVVSIVITTVAIAVVGAHLLWPALPIDVITLALIGIAILPWLGPIFESIEIPGGFKATLREIKETTQEAKDATLREIEETTREAKEASQAALSRTEEVHQTAQALLARTLEVKEAAQATLSVSLDVKEAAQAALSETQDVKEAAQATLSRSEVIDKKMSE